MKRPRITRDHARFLLIAACLFSPPSRAQIRHHDDQEFRQLEQTVDRQEAHIERDDSDIASNQKEIRDMESRIDRIEGIAKGISYALGSGLLYAAGRLFQKKKDSA